MVDCSDLAKNLTHIAMNIASREDMKTLDDVVAEMQTHLPQVRRQDVADAIVEATRTERRETDDLIQKLNEIKGEARQDVTLRAKINTLQTYLEKGEVPLRKKKARIPTEAIADLREIRDGLKKMIRESKPAQKAKLEKQIADLEKKISEGNFGPKTTSPKIFEDKELERLEYQRDRLKKEIRTKIIGMKPKSLFDKVVDPFNAIRALKTSFDFSAVLRQGGFIAFGHPVRAAKSIGPMLKAFSSERRSTKINSDILNRPNAPLYARSKLYIAPIDGTESLSKMEEAYMSRIAEKIPGVRASERAYLTFLNKLRADSFDVMVSTLSKNGQATQEEVNAISNFINVSTGRGNLGKLQTAAVGLNTVFFAPRYVASRFQLLSAQPLWKGTANTRKMVAKEYARYLIGLGTVYALGVAAGGGPEKDPRSSDFGKIRFGDTRLDPLSGLSQNTVLLSRIISGKTKSSTSGRVTKLRGKDVPYGGGNTWDVASRFLRSKLSPTVGLPMDVISGENVIGEKVSANTFAGREVGVSAVDLFAPLALADIYGAIKDQGVPSGTALGLLSIFGAGLQTYGYRALSKMEIAEKLAQKTYITSKPGQKAGSAHKGQEEIVAELMKVLKENGGTQIDIIRARERMKREKNKTKKKSIYGF